MVASTEQLLKILFGHLLAEDLVLLLSDLVEELTPADVLHDQVDELLVDVGLVVLDDVGVV